MSRASPTSLGRIEPLGRLGDALAAPPTLQLLLHRLPKPNQRPGGLVKRVKDPLSIIPTQSHDRAVVGDRCTQAAAKLTAYDTGKKLDVLVSEPFPGNQHLDSFRTHFGGPHTRSGLQAFAASPVEFVDEHVKQASRQLYGELELNFRPAINTLNCVRSRFTDFYAHEPDGPEPAP